MIGVEQLVPVDVGKMVQNALSLFSDLKGVKVENHCMGVEGVADSLLVQVFHNLIDNSSKYGEKATTVNIYAEKADDHSMRLFYRDDGVGIGDAHLRAHLFEKGFGRNTGLGLYLIRKICEVYGWVVQEKGQPGEGVCFEFTVPANARHTTHSVDCAKGRHTQ